MHWVALQLHVVSREHARSRTCVPVAADDRSAELGSINVVTHHGSTLWPTPNPSPQLVSDSVADAVTNVEPAANNRPQLCPHATAADAHSGGHASAHAIGYRRDRPKRRIDRMWLRHYNWMDNERSCGDFDLCHGIG